MSGQAPGPVPGSDEEPDPFFMPGSGHPLDCACYDCMFARGDVS